MTKRRKILLAVVVVAMVLGCVLVGLAIRDGVIGRRVCHGTFAEVQRALVHKATLPEGGTDYSVLSNAHVSIAHVSIEESAIRHWLQSYNEVPHELPSGSGFHQICADDAEFVSDGWLAQFQHGSITVTVVFDRQTKVAQITCE